MLRRRKQRHPPRRCRRIITQNGGITERAKRLYPQGKAQDVPKAVYIRHKRRRGSLKIRRLWGGLHPEQITDYLLRGLLRVFRLALYSAELVFE